MSHQFMTMQKASKEQIASLVKTNRKRKNYTQQQLAQLCGISLRSVQRIERAEVFPQDYTTKMLAKHLELTLDGTTAHEADHPGKMNTSQKIILSAGVAICIFLLGSAYVFQSPTFPETAFEMSLYVAALVIAYILLLLRIWRFTR